MTRFYKLSGSGNDFLALAEPWQTPPPERIRAWCRRGVSLGADGLFILRRAEGGATMDYFNADGLPADLCLNGTRCAAQLAFHLGWSEGTEGTQRTMRLHTGAGSVAARRLDEDRTAVELPAPAEPPQPLTVQIDGTSHAGWRILVGVPHFVLLWPDDLKTAPIRELGRQLRYHSVFGAPGANVNFVRFPARERMEIRTYERGVEDETLSCGTGTLAGAAVGLGLGKVRLPLRVETQGGFELWVDGDPTTGNWSLAGDARVVAAGELLPGAEVSPPLPVWEESADLAKA